MDIKTKDHLLYYFILECKDICKTDPVSKDTLKFLYKGVYEMSREEICQVIDEANIVMKNRLNKFQ